MPREHADADPETPQCVLKAGRFAREEDPALARGDRLVLLTDGLIEAASSSGEPFGYDRFEALLKEGAGSEPERLKETILEALESHTGSAPPDDDRTLVILSVV